MSLGTAFTVLAVLEATDKMSATLEKVDGALESFSETAAKAAEAATAAGEKIDTSFLQTASGADALDIANAKLAAAQDRVTATTQAQADAERALLDAQAQAQASADGDADATERLATAATALTAAQKQAALAAKEASAAADLQANVVRAQAAANDEAADATDVAAASQARLDAANAGGAESSGLMGKAMSLGALAIAAVGYESIKAAGNFQSLTEHLVTDGGETQSKLASVQAGILKISTATGTSTTELVAGMQHIESAGFHAAQGGLNVLSTAAEGAKVGNASLDTVSRALVSTMNAYGMSGAQATSMMNGLIATTAAGDMKMEDLAGSISSVSAVAAAAHIQFSQVAGALATMTAQGVTAQQGTQDLGHTIQSLSNPNSVQIKEMQAMGINSNDLSSKLGSRGLTGTFALLTAAVAAHTKGGQVLISTYNASQQAVANANIMIKAMSPSMATLAKQVLNGTISYNDYNTAIKALSPTQRALMTQFEGVANQTKKFNSLLTSTSPAAQTYNAAMSKMMGGTVGLNTALMVTGSHTIMFNASAQSVATAMAKGGKSVNDWSAIQGTFNQKLDVAKASVEATGIAIGTALLPAVTSIASAILSVLEPMAEWVQGHQQLVTILLSTVVGIAGFMAAVSAAKRIVSGVTTTISAVTKGFSAMKTGIGWVGDSVGKLGPMLSNAWAGISNGVTALGELAAKAYINVTAAAETATEWTIAGAQAAWAGIQYVALEASELAVAAASKVWAAGQWLVNAALDANPIGVVVVLIGTLIASVVYAYMHFQAFRTIINDVFSVLKTVVMTYINLTIDEFHALVAAGEWLWSRMEAVWNGVVSAGEAAASWLAALPGRVQGWFSGAASWLLDAGKNIVIGLYNGLVSMGSWMYSQVMSFVKDVIPGPILSVLGIASPSKWAHWAGQMTGTGLVNGLLSTHSAISAAAVKTAGVITDSLSAKLPGIGVHMSGGSVSLTTAGAGLTAMPSGGIGGGTTVYVTNDLRGSTISSQQAMNQLATAVGKAITKQLPGAGVHIGTGGGSR